MKYLIFEKAGDRWQARFCNEEELRQALRDAVADNEGKELAAEALEAANDREADGQKLINYLYALTGSPVYARA